MRAAIPQAARLRGGQTAATHLGDFDGLLTQTAVASTSAVLPHQAAVGIVRGLPPLHGKPSCPFLPVLRSRPRQLAPARGARTPHSPTTPSGSAGAPALATWPCSLFCWPLSSCPRMVRPGTPLCLPSGMLPGGKRGDTSGQRSCAVSFLHITT